MLEHWSAYAYDTLSSSFIVLPSSVPIGNL